MMSNCGVPGCGNDSRLDAGGDGEFCFPHSLEGAVPAVQQRRLEGPLEVQLAMVDADGWLPAPVAPVRRRRG